MRSRVFRRRPPFRLALVGLVVLLTALTGAAIGGLAWRDQRARSRALIDAAMAQATRLTAAHAERLLKDAESTARLGSQLVQQGQLDPGDTRALERFTLALLQAHSYLTWVSYGDRDDRFVGAWRDERGTVYVNHSFPADGRIRLEEDRVLPGGRREAVRRNPDHGYRPSERPYFKAVQARGGVAWTEPYEFYAGGGLGITCAAPLFDAKGMVRGAFTVDFSLDAAGAAVAGWIARPLRELAQLARRIRQGHLDVTAVPRSRDEIGVLTRAMGDMAQALRDRDFIRDTFGRYVSPELAEQCLRDRATLHLGGEVREVVMLMSDLRGFSALSERLGPTAMIDLLNRYFATMTPIIVAHGGIIDEFIGDAIFVLFGAPFSRGDDAARAVRCAWAMQARMEALNAESRTLGVPELSMGIGLHMGPVVAGNIGSPERLKYGVVGPAVNLVSRIQSLTAGGEVLLSDALAARVSAIVTVGPPRMERVKGLTEPAVVHRLLDVRPAAADDGDVLTPAAHAERP